MNRWAATASILPELPLSESDDLLLVIMSRLMASGEGGYWCSVLLMCALIAAMMSTADSGLMAIAAVLSNDLLGYYGRWRADGPRRLSASRALIAAKLVTACACAMLVLISSMEVSLTGLAALQQQLLSQALPSIWIGLHWQSGSKRSGSNV